MAKRKKSVKKGGKSKKGKGKKLPVRPQVPLHFHGVSNPHLWTVTELAKERHQVLNAVINQSQSVLHFGVYPCHDESHTQCHVTDLMTSEQSEKKRLELIPPSNYVYSISFMHKNIHSRCNLSDPVRCMLNGCHEDFRQSDVFLDHMRGKHMHIYRKLWQQSDFAFKPNASQFLNGMYTLIGSLDSRGKKGVRWVCAYCMACFLSPYEWNGHRHRVPHCARQVVEVLFNSQNKSVSEVFCCMNANFKDFECQACMDQYRPQMSQSMGLYGGNTLDLNTMDYTVGDETHKQVEKSADSDSDEKEVLFGNITEMMNHVCEQHTYEAFICLSCCKVVGISDETHHLRCLGISDEGLTPPRNSFPLSTQINKWADDVIITLADQDEVKIMTE